MRKFFAFLLSGRVIAFFVLIAVAVGIVLFMQVNKLGSPILMMLGLALLAMLYALYWLIKAKLANKAASSLESALNHQANDAVINAAQDERDEVAVIRQRLLEAIKTIKQSNLGKKTGRAALYELPWYMLIGHPAAGKSSVIAHGGLKLPLAGKHGIGLQGIAGTRNCDWFFTTEGILIDTAGRYSTQAEDKKEWLGFLGLLRRHRPRTPVNGVIIGVSIAELMQQGPAYRTKLAQQMRERIHELTEQLGIVFPVYVMFTKVDLIAGFSDFFEDATEAEQQQVWGATFPQSLPAHKSYGQLFAQRFQELCDGLKENALHKLSIRHGSQKPGLFIFPEEFQATKVSLAQFIGELVDDNPYQVRPLFRGFYFTSALQEGTPASPAKMQVRDHFALTANEPTSGNQSVGTFFLKNLFQNVIFPDKNLVQPYQSTRRRRWRLAGLLLCLGVFGVTLGGLTWSYVGNKKLIASVEQDVVRIRRLQASSGDFSSRLQALVSLQSHLEKLQKYRNEGLPLALRLGLYQGENIEHIAYQEYFRATKLLMLDPVSQNIEQYLQKNLQEIKSANAGEKAQVEDLYNALKTYLMLAEHQHVEEAHLLDQLPRFWRPWLDLNRDTMSKEESVRAAERIIAFYVQQVGREESLPIENQLTLVESARSTLKARMKAMPIKERVYSEIKSRANTRFSSVSISKILGGQYGEVIAGSHAIPGSFTKQAWQSYIQSAIAEASQKAVSHVDWVLKSNASEDLTLQGNPAQIQAALEKMYKEEYIREWQQLLQGVAIQEFRGLEQGGKALTVLADAKQSPLLKILQAVDAETSWDLPAQGETKTSGWLDGMFKEDKVPPSASLTPGMIAKAFSGLHVIMTPTEAKAQPQISLYFEALQKVRSNFNAITNSNDVGNGAKALLQATMSGNNSELAAAQKVVDDNLLATSSDVTRSTLRPMLIRPLVQSFAVLIPAASDEINQLWLAQVFEPWNKTVADKYPFSNSKVVAAPEDVARFIGENGLVSKFVQSGLGGLVVQRGNQISGKTWGGMGLQLNPTFINVLPNCLTAGASAAASPAPAATPAQATTEVTHFIIKPTTPQGFADLTLDIDGQRLRYKAGQAAEWTNFVWPNPSAQPGVRLVIGGSDGVNHEVLDLPGNFGLNKMIETAKKQKMADNSSLLSWTKDNLTVSIYLKVVPKPVQNESPPAGSPTELLRACVLPAKAVL